MRIVSHASTGVHAYALQAPSSKLQAPSSKLQAPSSRQIFAFGLRLITQAFGLLLCITAVWHAIELWFTGVTVASATMFAKPLLLPVQTSIGFGLFFYPMVRSLNICGFLLMSVFGTYQFIHLIFDGAPCDCLVLAHASPSTMFGLDIVGATGMLANAVNCRREQYFPLQSIVFRSLGLFTAAIALSGLIPKVWSNSGRLLISQDNLEHESIPADGNFHYRYVRITNVSTATTDLIGGTSNCSCTVLAGLPKTLRAFETITVPVGIRATKVQTMNKIKMVFHSNSTHRPTVSYSFRFRSIPTLSKGPNS